MTMNDPMRAMAKVRFMRDTVEANQILDFALHKSVGLDS